MVYRPWNRTARAQAGTPGNLPTQEVGACLEGEERVFQLVSEAAGKFAPCGDALGLDEAIALLDQLAGHPIEGGGELADLIARGDRDMRVPIAASDRAHTGDEFGNGPGDAGRGPPAQQDAQKNAGAVPEFLEKGPRSGFLFFPFDGKVKSLRSVELIYQGAPGPPVTLSLR